jgi:hypothetical protein
VRGLAFPARRIDLTGADDATSADAAFAAAKAARSRCSTATTRSGPHLAALVAAAARDRRAWAFGRVDVVDASRRDAGGPRAAERGRSADSDGRGVHRRRFALVVDTNLIVSCALAARTGRCAGRGPLWSWSLALDLLLVAEPAYADEAATACRPAIPRSGARPTKRRSRRSSAVTTRARSRHGRRRIRWRRRRTRSAMRSSAEPLHAGHVLLFDADAIDALVMRRAAWADAGDPRRAGVTFAGFAFGEFGLGENLRALARACADAGVPFDVRDAGLQVSSRQRDNRWRRTWRPGSRAP